MWKLYYFFLFIIFSLIVLFIDIIRVIPYIIIIYFYLLTPIYYLIFYILSYIRLVLPFLIIYFIISYNYKGYRIIKFFGIPLIFYKYKIYNYIFKYIYKDIYHFYLYFILIYILAYSLFEEIFILNLIIFMYINIYLYINIHKYIKFMYKNLKINFYINLFLLMIIYLYTNLFLNIHNMLDINYEIEDSIWELYNYKLILRYFYKQIIALKKLKEEAKEGLIKKVWRYMTEKKKKEESEEEKYIFKFYIFSRFSWVYFKLNKYFDLYINNIYNKYDDYKIPDEYDQRSLEYNWNNVYKIIKKTDDLIINKNIYINNDKLLYDEIESLPNRFKYNIIINKKETDINKLKTYKDYRKYIKIMWDELNTYKHFLPFGSNFTIDEGLDHILNRNKLDLMMLNINDNVNNKDKYIYSQLLDDILWHRYKNFNIKNLEKYYNLYYNNNMINISLENFFLNYMKKKHIYYENIYMVNNEIIICEELNKINFNKIDYIPKNDVKFKEKNNFQRFFGIFFIVNYMPYKSWLGKHLDNNYMYFFDKPEEIKSFNIYDNNKKKEYIKWEEYNIEFIKYDNILYNMFLEKKDKINMEFDNINLNYYNNNRITPINLKLEDYWKNKLEKYDVNYDELYNYVIEMLKKEEENKEK